jgi:hypothetical protein
MPQKDCGLQPADRLPSPFFSCLFLVLGCASCSCSYLCARWGLWWIWDPDPVSGSDPGLGPATATATAATRYWLALPCCSAKLLSTRCSLLAARAVRCAVPLCLRRLVSCVGTAGVTRTATKYQISGFSFNALCSSQEELLGPPC